MDKIRRVLVPNFIQLTHSRQVTNEGYTYISRTRQQESAIYRFKRENIYDSIMPLHNGIVNKPFSKGGLCRLGMARYCQIAERYEEPVTYWYPIYPRLGKIPLSTYVNNWRWYVPSQEIPERALDPRVRRVTLDGDLPATNKSGLDEMQMALRAEPVLPYSGRRKDVYKI